MVDYCGAVRRRRHLHDATYIVLAGCSERFDRDETFLPVEPAHELDRFAVRHLAIRQNLQKLRTRSQLQVACSGERRAAAQVFSIMMAGSFST